MKKILLAFFVISFSPALSQRLINHQSLYWLRYQNRLFFSPSVYWTNEADNRRFFGPDVQNQFIFHSHLHYKKNNWDVAGGLTLSWIFAQKPEIGFDHATMEIRPFVEGTHEFHLGKITFQNRIRLDNRFIEADKDKSIFDESTYVFRFRYRAQAMVPLRKNEKGQTTISLRLADEIMLNHIKNTFDQNRIYAISDFYISDQITLEAGYIYILQQRFGSDNEFYQRQVVRFSFLHKINLY